VRSTPAVSAAGKANLVPSTLTCVLAGVRMDTSWVPALRADGDREALRILVGARQEIIMASIAQASLLRAFTPGTFRDAVPMYSCRRHSAIASRVLPVSRRRPITTRICASIPEPTATSIATVGQIRRQLQVSITSAHPRIHNTAIQIIYLQAYSVPTILLNLMQTCSRKSLTKFAIS